MLTTILSSFWRNLRRHRLDAVLTVAGLSLGIATFLTLGLVARYEYRFNAWIPGAQSVYRIDEIYDLPGLPRLEVAGSTFAIEPYLRQEVPQIGASVRIDPHSVSFRHGETTGTETLNYVDPTFFDVLRLPLIQGKTEQALQEPDGIVLSDTLARKYFGRTDILGARLTIQNDGHKQDYVVSGVLAPQPANTTQPIDAMTRLPGAALSDPAFSEWGTGSGSIYIRIDNPDDVATVRNALDEVERRHVTMGRNDADRIDALRALHFTIVPLLETHFYDAHIFGDDTAADRRVIDSLFIVGLLALVAAAINYVNLATARALLRAREVAMRKVLGAPKGVLIAQFLGEAIMLALGAGIAGLALTELAAPVVNALGGWQVSLDYAFLLPVLLAVVLAIGLGAGAYPAFVLASFRPAIVLASMKIPSGGRMGARVRAVLAGVQFAFAVGLAICTLVVDMQARHLRTADRGFGRDGLLEITTPLDPSPDGRQRILRDALRSVPGVTAVTMANSAPGHVRIVDEPAWRPGTIGQRSTVGFVAVGPDFFRTLDIVPLAGRVFDDAHGDDDTKAAELSGHGTIIIDTVAMRIFGWSSPRDAVGQTLIYRADSNQRAISATIAGVVPSVRFQSMRNAQGPQIFRYYRDPMPYGRSIVRFAHTDPKIILARLAEKWRTLFPDIAFSAQTADEALAQYYRPDQQRGQLFTLGAAVALAVACLGLYGLAAFNTERRMHEVGIRKTLGATTGQIMRLMLTQFLRPVMLANLVAWPVAWACMQSWLAGFESRITLSPLYFLGVTACALVLCGVTVFSRTITLARAEPARALRAE
ncbi:ABC transporter permease [Gluconacetobacter tumulicola]|uniref:FtsX-like permease family protein n=1 Tax=Gluconacetobacter tumulicola TaxID=1017177 RepID=A0A7W4P916_9PROT|nr:ABC transporter permease [Gluconacetobacter tumulicola]MBB2179998.1 FtsX-like permease family protein [Gluconacetobacter tumulicola]